jgi:predicted TIM-barrel fold metal-dependent hydrolase
MATAQTKQRIISADSHVTITNEAFLEHLPKKYAPDVDVIVAETQAAAAAMNMPNNRAHRDWPAQGRPGDHVQEDRLLDQDEDGVEAEVLYSQSAFGFDGGTFYKLGSAEARVACFQAYNNALAQWIAAAPKRLIPVGIVPVLDPAEGVAELERLVAMGFKALTVPTYPSSYGLAPYWEDQYAPLWQAFAANGIPLSLHTNASPSLRDIQVADPTPAKGIFQSLPPIVMAELIGTWILGGMVPNNPNLHIVLVESGIGWIAYYLERLDTMSRRHNWPNRGMIKELPSSFWRNQFHATFEDDIVGMRTIDLLGAETLMFATDYPHPDSTWPESQAIVEKHFEGLPDATRETIVWKNAADLYDLH